MENDRIIEIFGKRLIRLSTLAGSMGLHIRTVQLWAKKHEMPVIRVGNQCLLDLDDLPEWLDRHKYATPASTAVKSASQVSAQRASLRDGASIVSRRAEAVTDQARVSPRSSEILSSSRA